MRYDDSHNLMTTRHGVTTATMSHAGPPLHDCDCGSTRGTVPVLVRCGVRGHQPQQAPLDLVALCLTVLLGGGATTVMVVVGPAYHVCTAVLCSPQVGRR